MPVRLVNEGAEIDGILRDETNLPRRPFVPKVEFA